MRVSTIMAKPMVKKRMGRPPISKRDDIAVKLDRNVAADVRYLAEKSKMSLAEYLTEMIRPMVAQRFQQIRKGDAK
jgi:hypothetical protein